MSVMRNIMWFEVERSIPIPTIAEWSEKDPLVLKFTFVSQLGVEWEFARELMFDVAEGRTEVAGEGDVQFYRADSTAVKMIVLGLRSPFGTVTMRASLLDVMEFVNEVNLQLQDEDALLQKILEDTIEKFKGDRA